MNIKEFVETVKNKSAGEITREDIIKYCYFAENLGKNNADPEKVRRKVFGHKFIDSIGKVFTIGWDQTQEIWARTGLTTETSYGTWIKAKQENELRKKWRKLIPSDMPVVECRQKIKELLGIKI